VPGHERSDGNEMADQLAKPGSKCSLIRPEPACGISIGVATEVVWDWKTRDHRKHWDSLTHSHQMTSCGRMNATSRAFKQDANGLSGLNQAKALIQRPNAIETNGLLKLNIKQLRRVEGLLKGHCLVNLSRIWSHGPLLHGTYRLP
jgi:hypothetical protein